MKKGNILVYDSRGVFFKMFKRTFKDEFNFSEYLLDQHHNEFKKSDRSIFVVYEEKELLDFLNLDKEGLNILVCLFNKHLYSSLSFLEESNNLILLDESKTKHEMVQNLKAHLKRKSDQNEQNNNAVFPKIPIFCSKFKNLHTALFCLN